MINKIWATIVKDFRILTRDRVGLTLMFVMPILLVIVITTIQNSTFKLVNNRKMALLICNKDSGGASIQFIQTIQQMGMFDVHLLLPQSSEHDLKVQMQARETLIALIIPLGFSERIKSKAENIAQRALDQPSSKTIAVPQKPSPLQLFYHPVLDETFRHSIQGALQSTFQVVEGRETIQTLHASLLSKPMPADLEAAILTQSITIAEIPTSRDGSAKIPNATQHNVPAWTLFAMFFIVISLGGSIVREKQSGSFIRLKTLPTSYLVAIISKQLTYLLVTLSQVFVIFSLGIWFFPLIHLPPLFLPNDILGLVLVSVICGWTAVSYAICVGVIAFTQEQANGFGAVSIVILSAIGGVLVPSFAMPDSFDLLLKLSPLHWGLESYYILFLEQGTFLDLIPTLLPLLLFIVAMQSLTWYSLKRKNLI